MDSVEEFLAYSIKLEQEAALRFGELADSMDACGNREVGKLFRQLSEYSKLHLADAMARSGFREIPAKKPGDFEWPGLESPEAAAIWAADPMIGVSRRLRSPWPPKSVLDTTTDPEIKAMAKEFVIEESEHVAELQKWIAAHKAGKPLPVDR